MTHNLMKLKDLLRDWGTLVAVVLFFLGDHMRVMRHESIIDAYERHGTPAVVEMKATYDERLRSQDSRISKLETIAASNNIGIQDIRTDMKSVFERLLSIKDSLDEHKKMTREFFKATP